MRMKILATVFCFLCSMSISAQTTAFTYQGSLKEGANPANGNFDFEFKLFDAVNAGTQQGSTQQRLNVTVANGVFAVSLDFGAGTLPGANRFLDIAVRTTGGGAFTPLTPRQQVNSAPYSVRSLNSTTADVAANATQLGGVASSQYVTTTNGGTNFIQNTTTQQSSSNFNISGNGAVGGKFGIGLQSPTIPLTFANTLGDKVSMWTNGLTSYGFGIQSGLLQMHTDISSSDIAFGYGSSASFAEKMRIKGNGNVGIGTISPAGNLHINAPGSSDPINALTVDVVSFGTASNAVNSYFFKVRDVGGGSTPAFLIRGDGNVGINTDSPQHRLHVVQAAGGFSGSTGGIMSQASGTAGDRWGIWGEALSSGFDSFGVIGKGTGGSSDNIGVFGEGSGNTGAFKVGILGQASGDGGQNFGGYFYGNVQITGTLTKGGGAFKIDHPLDPENKYLSHSFVESPDMMNIYNGNVTTDANGDATIKLPDWFEALNKDFRYQLTVIGVFAQAIVADELKENQFKIKTDKPAVKVSWQVTGIRHDKFADDNRIKVEEQKNGADRGKCLYSAICGGAELGPKAGIQKKP